MKLYLAYGINMHMREMEKRLGSRMAQVVGKAMLKNYRLAFRGVRGEAMPTLDFDEGAHVPCLLWILYDPAESILDECMCRYTKKYVDIEYGGKLLENVLTYVLKDDHRRFMEVPSDGTAIIIREAYQSLCMPMGILDTALEQARAASDSRAMDLQILQKWNNLPEPEGEREKRVLYGRRNAIRKLELYRTIPRKMQLRLATEIAISMRAAGLTAREQETLFGPGIETGVLEAAQDGSVDAIRLLLFQEIEKGEYNHAGTLIKLISQKEWQKMGRAWRYRWQSGNETLDGAIISLISAAVAHSEIPEQDLNDMRAYIQNENPELSYFIDRLKVPQ